MNRIPFADLGYNLPYNDQWRIQEILEVGYFPDSQRLGKLGWEFLQIHGGIREWDTYELVIGLQHRESIQSHWKVVARTPEAALAACKSRFQLSGQVWELKATHTRFIPKIFNYPEYRGEPHDLA